MLLFVHGYNFSHKCKFRQSQVNYWNYSEYFKNVLTGKNYCEITNLTRFREARSDPDILLVLVNSLVVLSEKLAALLGEESKDVRVIWRNLKSNYVWDGRKTRITGRRTLRGLTKRMRHFRREANSLLESGFLSPIQISCYFFFNSSKSNHCNFLLKRRL